MTRQQNSQTLVTGYTRVPFFGTPLRTLNYILVGDRIWGTRVESAGDGPSNLGAVLVKHFQDLCTARDAGDALMKSVTSLSKADIAGTFD